MKKPIRLAILALFAAGFAVTVPVVIMSNTGYRYNWQKGQLEKTGIIKFVTEPSGAKVWINDRLQPRTTPMSVFRLLPEDYRIRMELEGYNDWNKTLEVRSGETTFTEDVVLVRRTSPRPAMEMDWRAGRWSHDKRRLAAIRQGGGGLELTVVSGLGQEEILLARLAPDLYEDLTVNWSPDDRYLSLQGNLKENPGLRQVTVYPLPLTELTPTVLTRQADGRLSPPARWSDNGRQLSLISGRSVSVYDSNGQGGQLVPGTAQAVDAQLTQGKLLVIRQTAGRQQLQDIDPQGNRPPSSLLDLPPGQWHFSLTEGDYLLLANDRNAQGLLYRLNDKATFGPWSGTDGRWEKPEGGGRLLIWNDFEISYWDPETEDRSIVTRLSSPIDQCLWDPTGRNVIFSAGSSLLAAETDRRDGRNTYELNRMTDIGPISLDPLHRQLLFLGTAGNQRALFQQGF